LLTRILASLWPSLDDSINVQAIVSIIVIDDDGDLEMSDQPDHIHGDHLWLV